MTKNLLLEATPNSNASTKNLLKAFRLAADPDSGVCEFRPGYLKGNSFVNTEDNVEVVYIPKTPEQDIEGNGFGGINSPQHKQYVDKNNRGISKNITLIDFYRSTFKRLDIEEGGIEYAEKQYSKGNFASRNIYCLIDGGQLANFYCWTPGNRKSNYDFKATSSSPLSTGDPKYWTKGNGAVVADSTKLGKSDLYKNADEVWEVNWVFIDDNSVMSNGLTFKDRKDNPESGKNVVLGADMRGLKDTIYADVLANLINEDKIKVIGHSKETFKFYTNDAPIIGGYNFNHIIGLACSNARINYDVIDNDGRGGGIDVWAAVTAYVKSKPNLATNETIVGLVTAIMTVYAGGLDSFINRITASGKVLDSETIHYLNAGKNAVRNNLAARRYLDVKIRKETWEEIARHINALNSNITEAIQELQERKANLQQELADAQGKDNKELVRELRKKLNDTMNSLATAQYKLHKIVKGIDTTGESVIIASDKYETLRREVRKIKVAIADSDFIKESTINNINSEIAAIEEEINNLNASKAFDQDTINSVKDVIGDKISDYAGPVGANPVGESIEEDVEVMPIESTQAETPVASEANTGMINFIQMCWSQVSMLEQPEFANLGALVDDLKDSLYVAIGQAEKALGAGNETLKIGGVSDNKETTKVVIDDEPKTDDGKQVITEIEDAEEPLEESAMCPSEYEKHEMTGDGNEEAIKAEKDVERFRKKNVAPSLNPDECHHGHHDHHDHDHHEHKNESLEESWLNDVMKSDLDLNEDYVNSIDFNF